MSAPTGLPALRSMAINASLRQHASLSDAIDYLGFVQYDPIRAPARAQDLILGQRVTGYRAGDLDRAYEALDLEEDDLHVYGVMPRHVASLLHPRCDAAGLPLTYEPSELESAVLAAVHEQGRVDLHTARVHGAHGVANAWGGTSSASTRALESLHYYGLLRVAGRRNGNKIYAPSARVTTGEVTPEERLRRIALVLAGLLAPVPQQTLSAGLAYIRRRTGGIPVPSGVIRELQRTSELESSVIDGVTYLWPAGMSEVAPAEEPRVRFLAPFDPVVWDRRRFEHFWGWQYRFEAYTPVSKRVRGYYAMPLLWRDEVIGWVNCSVAGGALSVLPGYAAREPKGREFRRAFADEVEHMKMTLGVG